MRGVIEVKGDGRAARHYGARPGAAERKPRFGEGNPGPYLECKPLSCLVLLRQTVGDFSLTPPGGLSILRALFARFSGYPHAH